MSANHSVLAGRPAADDRKVGEAASPFTEVRQAIAALYNGVMPYEVIARIAIKPGRAHVWAECVACQVEMMEAAILPVGERLNSTYSGLCQLRDWLERMARAERPRDAQ